VYDRNRRVYTKHLPSTVTTPEKLVWKTALPQRKDSLDPEPTHLEIADTPSPPNTSSQIADMLVPVSIPVPTTLVPTFHSCLISRTYILETSIKLTSQGCTRTANLRLPLQISADMGEHFVDFPAGEQMAVDALLPGYFDGGYTGGANTDQTYEELIAGDMEDDLLSQQLASVACADTPPAYCIYL
jgi:hypothetical protein